MKTPLEKARKDALREWLRTAYVGEYYRLPALQMTPYVIGIMEQAFEAGWAAREGETVSGRLATGPNLQDIIGPTEPRDAVRRSFINYPIQAADDVGKHNCDMLACRKCHNCGSEGGRIHGPWNLCDGCDQERAYNDADDAEYEEALLRAECDDDEVGYVAEPEDDWDEDERG
ncbi:hypothetical protein LCGC14_0975610 [marine sediment metagenome]|uniref:Uncharacterized protein n=1 Tax=marine sediment metagenome TaxID=412755 RepID=A0A0F9NWJ0_9ZZZZ